MQKMKKFRRIMLSVCSAAVLCFSFCQPVFAMTESEIQAQVNAMGKAAASGNVLIWFLCAIAFLKVSQKIDSFMSSLGINVGHTGGSMLAEAMIAARGIGGLKNFSSQYFGGGHSKVSSHTNASSKGFMSGGLAGIVGSRITNNAVKSATASSKTNVSRPSGKSGGGIGSHIYASSVSKGGSFANNVIGTVAAGNIAEIGFMSGPEASQALQSYLGYAALGENAGCPSFRTWRSAAGVSQGRKPRRNIPRGLPLGCIMRLSMPLRRGTIPPYRRQMAVPGISSMRRTVWISPRTWPQTVPLPIRNPL